MESTVFWELVWDSLKISLRFSSIIEIKNVPFLLTNFIRGCQLQEVTVGVLFRVACLLIAFWRVFF